MRLHVNTDKELVQAIREGLRENDGYCPCVLNSKGNEDYRCICKEMREQVPVGQTCHCGLYIKDEM